MNKTFYENNDIVYFVSFGDAKKTVGKRMILNFDWNSGFFLIEHMLWTKKTETTTDHGVNTMADWKYPFFGNWSMDVFLTKTNGKFMALWSILLNTCN